MKKLFITVLYCVAGFTSFAQEKWEAPTQANALVNPRDTSTTSLNEARLIYRQMCSPCHGYKGKGDGCVSDLLHPRPADHTSTAVQSQTDGALFWKVSTGRGKMQSYQAVLSERQRWRLVDFIRTLRN